MFFKDNALFLFSTVRFLTMTAVAESIVDLQQKKIQFLLSF